MPQAQKSCWGATHGENAEKIMNLASENAPSPIHEKLQKIVFCGEIIGVPKLEPLESELYNLLVETMYENAKKEPTIQGML